MHGEKRGVGGKGGRVNIQREEGVTMGEEEEGGWPGGQVVLSLAPH